MATKLHSFKTSTENREVSFVETIQVKEGVECDTYSFVGDDTQDLAIVRVVKGFKTPRQRILQGYKTTEGIFEGQGTLAVHSEDGDMKTYSFDSDSTDKEVVVQIGQIMQWTAPNDTDLVFYEICDPPYKDGRFENLPDYEDVS